MLSQHLGIYPILMPALQFLGWTGGIAFNITKFVSKKSK